MADPQAPGSVPSRVMVDGNGYSDAILRTMRQPLVVLDAALNVLLANPAFYATFQVEPAETVGRKIYHLGNGQWNIAALRDLLEDILPRDGQVEGYRVLHVFETIGNRIMVLNARRMQREGQADRILLAIDDVTSLELALWELEGLKEFAEKIVDASRDAVLILGWDLRVKSANRKFYDLFGVDPVSTEGQLIYDLVNGQWDMPQLRELLENVLLRAGELDDFVVEHFFEGIGQRTMVLNARRIDHIEFILLAIEDVTESRRTAALLRETTRRESFLLALSDGLRAQRTAADIAAHALRMLREHLDLDRTFLAETRGTQLPADILGESSGHVVPPFPTSLDPAEFPVAFRKASEGMYIVQNVATAAALGERDRESLARIALGSFIVAPLQRAGVGMIGALVVGSDGPRSWSEAEAALVAECAERIWAAIERARAEAAQRASDERYAALFDTIDQGFCVVEVREREGRLDYRVVEANPAFYVKTGFTSEVFGRWMREVAPDLEEHWYVVYGRVAMTGVAARFEEGSAALGRWFDVYAFRFGAPEESRVAILFNDISDRKRQEDALRESEERFRRFGDASRDVLWIRDAGSMQWQYLTRAYEDIYGIDRAQAVTGNDYRDWLALVMPQDRPVATRALRRVRAGEHATFEFRVKRHLDGAVRWLRNSEFPITDERGRVTSIGGIGHDLTELRETELRLKTLMEGIPQLVWRARSGGLWTWASPQWVAFTGLSSDASAGLGWLEALHPDDRAGAVTFWTEAEETGKLEMEARICRVADGEYYWFQWRATPVRDEAGQILEWLGTSTDVNELRRMQERQQVMVAELQHRTRNLIAVVRSIAQQTMKASEGLDSFRHAFGDRLAALSRVQGLLSQANDTQITIGALLHSELDALGAGEAGGRIVIRGPEVALRNSVVQTLALAFHELATNARKYGALSVPDGRLEVVWQVGEDARGRSRLDLLWAETALSRGDEDRGNGRDSGYGRELIERALPYSLGAETSYELSRAGVRCRIALPLTEKAG